MGRRPADHDPHYTRELRNRVLDELATVQGRVALAHTALDPTAAKEQLRLAHRDQRLSLLQDNAEWLWENEASLLAHFADGSEVVPALIDPVVMPVRTQLDADLFRYATLTWSVPVSAGYGRRSRFLVRDRHNGKLIAVFALGDPVIAQAARDAAVGWTTEQRNNRLYNVYDAFVLGAVEPYRQLIAGKLVALLSLSNETRDFLTQKYTGSVTGIREQTKDPTPLLITTSSALGRSSIYNRLVFRGQTMFHSVGFTRGYGHFQFSNSLFAELRGFVRDSVLEDPNAKVASTVYGSGPNWRFRVIRTALKALEIPEESLQHNVRREVFLAPTATHWDQFLRGETEEYEPFDLPAVEIGHFWRDRWAVGRAERRPAYAEWTRHQARLTTELTSSVTATGHKAPKTHGRVDMGAYSVAIAVAREDIRGRTANGVAESGIAVFHRLEGPGLALTFADVHWANGERELRGWDRQSSGAPYEALVGRLRMGVHATERYRGMSSAEIRLLKVNANGSSTQVYKTTDGELESLLGFSVSESMDAATEAMVGTRGELLKDEGARKNQLAVVFESSDLVTPALAWVLSRALPFKLQTDPYAERPTSPVISRRAPRLEDIHRGHYTSPGA